MMRLGNIELQIVDSSVSLFLLFCTLDIKSSKVNTTIRFIPPSIFAVYLIHDNPQLYERIWGYVYNLMHLTHFRCIGEFFVAVAAIFFFCVLIDLIRRLIFSSLAKCNLVTRASEKLKSINLI